MTFVVVGGGPTGVELAGALGEIANDTLREDFRSIRPPDARIVLVEALDRILPTYPADRSRVRASASSRSSASRCGPRRASWTSTRTASRRERPDGAGEDPGADGALGGRRAGVVVRRGGRGRRPAPRPIGRAGSGRAGPDDPRPPRDLRASAMPPCSRGSRTSPCPASRQGGIQGGKHAAEAIAGAGWRRAGAAVPLPGPRRRRGHRAAVAASRTSVARAVRAPGRVHRLGAVARHPHLVPDRVREPGRRDRPLGMVVPRTRPRGRRAAAGGR